MYTDPEVAVVGKSESEARKAHDDVLVGRVPMSTSGRALSANKPAGYVKVVAAPNGELLGAQIVGARASDTIAEATLALELDATVDDLRGRPTPIRLSPRRLRTPPPTPSESRFTPTAPFGPAISHP
ncbi:hypothetical protein ACFQER_10255 [Halomicroarcula sp. GCM10025894]|uniref:hypothetical protein n=1 Tax=Halomicroarcula sp. GCM10025894 TaxID=3252673 RepID=UPI00360D3759